MSTFVLKREYALQMPCSYVDIDRGEMEYVDGGYRSSRQTWVPAQTIRISVGAYATAVGISSLTLSVAISAITGGTAILVITKQKILEYVLQGSVSVIGSWSGAKALDTDGDGYITRYVSGHYETEYNPYPMHSYEGARF